MGPMRFVPAALFAVALVLGSGGFAPQPVGSPAGDADLAAAMLSDQAMPECPVCTPDDTAKAVCAPACVGFAAILSEDASVAATPAMTGKRSSPAGRLRGKAAGPEPHPPKAIILA